MKSQMSQNKVRNKKSICSMEEDKKGEWEHLKGRRYMKSTFNTHFLPPLYQMHFQNIWIQNITSVISHSTTANCVTQLPQLHVTVRHYQNLKCFTDCRKPTDTVDRWCTNKRCEWLQLQTMSHLHLFSTTNEPLHKLPFVKNKHFDLN